MGVFRTIRRKAGAALDRWSDRRIHKIDERSQTRTRKKMGAALTVNEALGRLPSAEPISAREQPPSFDSKKLLARITEARKAAKAYRRATGREASMQRTARRVARRHGEKGWIGKTIKWLQK